MTIDGKPFFAISGECHFTRAAEKAEDEHFALGEVALVETLENKNE